MSRTIRRKFFRVKNTSLNCVRGEKPMYPDITGLNDHSAREKASRSDKPAHMIQQFLVGFVSRNVRVLFFY